MSRERRRRQSRDSQRSEGLQVNQYPWTLYEYIDLPIQRLGDDGIEKVVDTAYRVLEEIGVDFFDPQAVNEMRAAGADVDPDSSIVRINRAMVKDYISSAPSNFTVTPRNPRKQIRVGGKHVLFAPVSSAPFVMDLDEGRRNGTFEHYINFLKLTQSYDCMHFTMGHPVEPQDIHPSIRHLKTMPAKVIYTDKVFHGYSLGLERILDTLEIARIGRGTSWDDMIEEPGVFSNINTSSPLRLDTVMLIGMRECAKRNQPVVVTPFTLSGAMAPITTAGALTLQTAEALAGLVFLQVVRRGARCVFGSFTPNVDMKSGAPAFGTPEFILSAIASGEIARYFNLPLRSSMPSTSNQPDAQGAYETVFSMMGSTMGQANMIFHSAGWLEGGLIASYEKFVIDCDIVTTYLATLRQIPTTEDDCAFSAIKEVGHQGHYFGVDHTMARYQTEFWRPLVSDWTNYEAWEVAGAQDTAKRANTLYKKILDEYEAPPIDPAIKEELEEFAERRIREGGIATDF